jgi:hypothetical protein
MTRDGRAASTESHLDLTPTSIADEPVMAWAIPGNPGRSLDNFP